MAGDMPYNAGSGRAFFEVLIDAVLIKICAGPGAGEKNVSGLPTLEPVLCQKIEVPVRKECISISPALAFN